MLTKYLYLGVALALAALLSTTHLMAYRHGKTVIRAEWSASVAAANVEAFKKSERLQRNVDVAAAARASAENRLRADAVNARAVAGGLRDDLSRARDYAAQSRAAAQRVADLSTELLERCTASYLAVAEAAQRADSEARELRQGWPR